MEESFICALAMLFETLSFHRQPRKQRPPRGRPFFWFQFETAVAEPVALVSPRYLAGC